MSNIVTVMDVFVRSRLEGVHTLIPAKIDSYNPDSRKATVVPLVRLRMEAGPLITIPPIDNVPVMFPSSQAFSFSFPLAAGDTGALFFSEAGIGNWLDSIPGKIVDPEDCSRFSLTDGIFVPGLWPWSGVPKPQGSIVAGNDSLQITDPGGCTIQMDGSKVTINGNLEVSK